MSKAQLEETYCKWTDNHTLGFVVKPSKNPDGSIIWNCYMTGLNNIPIDDMQTAQRLKKLNQSIKKVAYNVNKLIKNKKRYKVNIIWQCQRKEKVIKNNKKVDEKIRESLEKLNISHNREIFQFPSIENTQ